MDIGAENIFVHLLDMDSGIKEQVIANTDGSYSIFLNSKLSHEDHIASYNHALKHIKNLDFEKSSADEIEQYSHQN